MLVETMVEAAIRVVPEHCPRVVQLESEGEVTTVGVGPEGDEAADGIRALKG